MDGFVTIEEEQSLEKQIKVRDLFLRIRKKIDPMVSIEMVKQIPPTVVGGRGKPLRRGLPEWEGKDC